MKTIKMYSPVEKRPTKDWRRLPKSPNPPPTDIVKLIEIVAQYAGLATVVYKTIKLWFDYQNAKYIKIKKGDVELVFKGGSTKEAEKFFSQFRKLTRGTKGEVKVTLPPNADRSLPSETDDQKTIKKKGSKK